MSEIAASVLAAAIPTVAYVLIIWWCDRYEKEPIFLLAAAFVWGAAPAILLSLGAELALDAPLAGYSDLGRDLASASIVAPIVEEIAKAIALYLIYRLFREEFDGILDGIIYGALVGFGFAMTENFFYLISEVTSEGWESFGILAVLRTVVFGLNHAFYTAFTGAGFGYARSARSPVAKVAVPVLGLLVGMGFHSVHNLGATLSGEALAAIGISLIADAGGVLIIIAILVLALRQERRWIAEELRPEIGILLTVDEYRIAQSPWKRLRARGKAATRSLAHGRNVARFYRLLAELAFRLHRYRHGRASAKDLRAIPHLREQIVRLRSGPAS